MKSVHLNDSDTHQLVFTVAPKATTTNATTAATTATTAAAAAATMSAVDEPTPPITAAKPKETHQHDSIDDHRCYRHRSVARREADERIQRELEKASSTI